MPEHETPFFPEGGPRGDFESTTHWHYETLRAAGTEIGNGWLEARVELGAGDTAPYPGSTKRWMRGKGGPDSWVAYRIPPDGGLYITDSGGDVWISRLDGVS